MRLGGREPSPNHPFGHGQQRFLWTFVAALLMFLAGAVFAIAYGIYELAAGGGEEGGFLVGYVVLPIAFVAEGVAWVRALRQTRGEAREAGRSLVAHIRQSRDPSVKMVLLEDSAALTGLVIAAGGLALHQATGFAFWDPVASVLIGVLLIGMAAFIGHDSQDLLVGTAARPEERDAIERAIEEHDEVGKVIELLTLALGPQALLVAARIDLKDGVTAERVEQVSTQIDCRVREVVPDVTEVFLDATQADVNTGRP